MKIGNVKINNNVFLAPMAGITDLPFRLLCREKGAGLAYTEMISAKGLYYNDKKTKILLDHTNEDKPYAAQIFGSEPNIMAFAAKDVVKYGYNIVDINMGCPTPKITKNGEGSALMRNLDLIEEIVCAVSSSVNVPVTVKIRKGWDDNYINAVKVAQLAEKNGAKAVAVHGRTREQFYSGKADWDIIRKVKKAVNIPVIGNGDIFSASDAKEMIDYTGCDAVMVARGARGNPWIFNQILELLNNNKIVADPEVDERIKMAIRHISILSEYKGEYIGIREGRKHIAWYLKGLKGSKHIKVEINKMNDLHKIEQFLLQYIDDVKGL